MRHSIQSLTFLLAICFSLLSCSPWKSEINEIYEAAQQGDRLSQFAIVKEREDFQEIVPKDTIDAYLWKFIKEGRPEAFELASYEGLVKNPAFCTRDQERNETDWCLLGIRNNDGKSYEKLGNYYERKYEEKGNPQDSLKAEDLYAKGIEAGNVDLWYERDLEAGVGALITGGIKWGKYSYKHQFNERAFITRLALTFAEVYVFIMGGAITLIFSAEWWKAILTLIGLIALLFIPIAIPVMTIKTAYGQKHNQDDGDFIRNGILFGFWNYLCYIVARTSENMVWTNNVYSLWFPVSAYGIQPYFPIIMNWFTLLYLAVTLFKTYKIGTKNGYGMNVIAKQAGRYLLIFAISYFTAQVGGILIIVILILCFALSFGSRAIAEAPSILYDVLFESGAATKDTSSDSKSKTVSGRCESCMHWNSHTHECRRDTFNSFNTGNYDFCDRWTRN